MGNELATFAQVRGTLIDLALRFGPKLVTATLIMTAGSFAAGSPVA